MGGEPRSMLPSREREQGATRVAHDICRPRAALKARLDGMWTMVLVVRGAPVANGHGQDLGECVAAVERSTGSQRSRQQHADKQRPTYDAL